MQIVSETVFQKVSEPIVSFKNTHNRIIYITKTAIVAQTIDLKHKRQMISLQGQSVLHFEISHNNTVAFLFQNGHLQIRKADKIESLLGRYQLPLNKTKGVKKMRWLNEDLYLVYGEYIDVLNAAKQRKNRFFSIPYYYLDQQIADIAFSSVLPSQTILTIQFTTMLTFTLIPTPVGLLDIQGVTDIKMLSHPLQMLRPHDYLLLVLYHRWVKIINIFTLQPISSIDLKTQKQQSVQVVLDPFCEYLMARVSRDGRTHKNIIMKINCEYYYSAKKAYEVNEQPFFSFIMDCVTKQKLLLFPCHLQNINQKAYHSIDMCSIDGQQIKLISFAVQVGCTDMLYPQTNDKEEWDSDNHAWRDQVHRIMEQHCMDLPKDQKASQYKQPNKLREYDKDECIQKVQRQKALDLQSLSNEQLNMYLTRYISNNILDINTDGFLTQLSEKSSDKAPIKSSSKKELETQDHNTLSRELSNLSSGLEDDDEEANDQEEQLTYGDQELGYVQKQVEIPLEVVTDQLMSLEQSLSRLEHITTYNLNRYQRALQQTSKIDIHSTIDLQCKRMINAVTDTITSRWTQSSINHRWTQSDMSDISDDTQHDTEYQKGRSWMKWEVNCLQQKYRNNKCSINMLLNKLNDT